MNSGGTPSLVETLIRAHADYQTSTYYDEVLDEVTARVRERGDIGKLDIGAPTAWKRLRASTPWMDGLMRESDAAVRALTRPAVEAARDPGSSIVAAAEKARAALVKVPGCGHGPALSSALLLAAAPDRMAVYDRRAHAAIDSLLPGRLSKKPSGLYARYMEVVEELRSQVNGWPGLDQAWLPRDVDKALFVLGGNAA